MEVLRLLTSILHEILLPLRNTHLSIFGLYIFKFCHCSASVSKPSHSYLQHPMAKDKKAHAEPEAIPKNEETETKGKKSDSAPKPSTVPSKRKAKAPSSPSKAPRRSARSTPKTARNPIQILQFLLSSESLPLTRPKDELFVLSESDSKLRTYSDSDFTPFEELVCAVILSRPISHALGVRSIRTLLNQPYEYSTPEKLKEAGFEGVRKALDEAKTQHRQKTAEELVGLAEAVTGVIKEGKEDWEEAVRGKLKEDLDEVICQNRCTRVAY